MLHFAQPRNAYQLLVASTTCMVELEVFKKQLIVPTQVVRYEPYDFSFSCLFVVKVFYII